MYIPLAFRQEDSETLVAFMRTHSFAVVVNGLNGSLIASHVPLVTLIEPDSIKLVGHLAKANPHWQAFASSESLAIFTGPHAYVSPSHYEKQENVPTWNYIAVHAYGQARTITLADSTAQMDEMIDTMIQSYEPGFQSQWDSLSDTYRNKMMNGIVGFEIIVSRLEGKYKLSQNRSLIEQHHIADALVQSTDPMATSIAAEMQRNLTPPS